MRGLVWRPASLVVAAAHVGPLAHELRHAVTATECQIGIEAERLPALPGSSPPVPAGVSLQVQDPETGRWHPLPLRTPPMLRFPTMEGLAEYLRTGGGYVKDLRRYRPVRWAGDASVTVVVPKPMVYMPGGGEYFAHQFDEVRTAMKVAHVANRYGLRPLASAAPGHLVVNYWKAAAFE